MLFDQSDRALVALRGLSEISIRGHEGEILGDGYAEMQGIQGVQYDLRSGDQLTGFEKVLRRHGNSAVGAFGYMGTEKLENLLGLGGGDFLEAPFPRYQRGEFDLA